MANHTTKNATDHVEEPGAETVPVPSSAIASELKPETVSLSVDDSEKDEVKAAPEHGAVATATAQTPSWPNLTKEHPLSKFFGDLSGLLKEAEHDEVYGIKLMPDSEGSYPNFQTLLILQKFLRANADDLTKAKEQLSKTLKWRKEFQPTKAMAETFKKDKFGGLGYVTVVGDENLEGTSKIVTTWNVYGAIKDYEKTFTPVDEFLRWRIALMEFGVSKLNLHNAKQPIPDYGRGVDPYQGIQVHDYKSVSFLRMDPRAKAASKHTIQMLGEFYPETLSRKFFVNVPIVMQWMFAAMRIFVSAETSKKFVVLSNGVDIASEMGELVPKEYGGELGALQEVGEGMKLS